jgi:formate dehydrogenase subunit gamma
VLAGKDEYLPEIGKYNAGQKFVFWSMVWLVPIMFISGLGLWETGLVWVEQYFGYKATIEHKRLAAVVHALAAVLMIVIWITHVYAAIWVRGTISAMTRGSVTGGWGWRHHRKWLRQEVGAAKSEASKQQAAE